VKWIVPAVLILLLTPICLAADKDEPLKPAQSTDELRRGHQDRGESQSCSQDVN
jgi:hypothetical protein